MYVRAVEWLAAKFARLAPPAHGLIYCHQGGGGAAQTRFGAAASQNHLYEPRARAQNGILRRSCREGEAGSSSCGIYPLDWFRR